MDNFSNMEKDLAETLASPAIVEELRGDILKKAMSNVSKNEEKEAIAVTSNGHDAQIAMHQSEIDTAKKNWLIADSAYAAEEQKIGAELAVLRAQVRAMEEALRRKIEATQRERTDTKRRYNASIQAHAAALNVLAPGSATTTANLNS